jgi:hypothetical protein
MRQLHARLALTVAFTSLLLAGCGRGEGEAVDEAKAAGKTPADFPTAEYDYFGDMDAAFQPAEGDTPAGVRPLRLSPDEIKGRNTWMMWCGGNEAFWDWLANRSYGSLDLLKLVASPGRDEALKKRAGRFTQAGLVNEPGCGVADDPDDYGLFLEPPRDRTARAARESVYGRSSGVVGLRLFRNPRFDDAARKRWDARKYFIDPAYYTDPKLVRPYRVGMSCAFCHAAPHPLHPPADPAAPEWADLSTTIGNQYFRTRAVFGGLLAPDSFVYHVLDSQPPGTIDTSLVASDNINNPNTMNAIFAVPARLDRAGVTFHRSKEWLEKNAPASTNTPEKLDPAARQIPNVLSGIHDDTDQGRPVPRILLDGSDSVGAWGALARVYLNIGTFSEEWVKLHNPVVGFQPQKPFRIAACEKNSVYWQVNNVRVEYLAKFFLKSTDPMRLKDAPGGKAHLKLDGTDAGGRKVTGEGYPWDPQLHAGRKVFARRCVVCHSGKQPAGSETYPADQLLELLASDGYQKWAQAAVQTREFWQDNFLSTDRRVPVTLVRTNAGRSLATNGIADHMWEDFTSRTYKDLPSAGAIRYYDPYSGKVETFPTPAGGRGYYRPASLISIWATAPFLHNNSVGLFNNDPSVKGRMEAFDDGIAKLLVRADRTTDENGRPLSQDELEEQAAPKRWQTKGVGINGSTTDRLREDHGLIWRTPNETSIRVPAKDLPWLLNSTVGPQLPYLRDHPDAVTFLNDYPWAVPLVVLALALAILCAARWRWLRYFGYAVAVLGVAVAFGAFFFAGKEGDLVLGPIPEGTPVNLLANVDPDHADSAKLREAIRDAVAVTKKYRHDKDELRRQMRERVAPKLLAVSKCPDLVMDRGHYFAAALTEQELNDLIDLLKTF